MDTEITIIKTDDQGKRSASLWTLYPMRHLGVGFLYRYLRETRRKDAPPGFQFGTLTEDQVKRIEAIIAE